MKPNVRQQDSSQIPAETKSSRTVTVMVSNQALARRKGDSIFTEYTEPDGRVVWVLNRAVHEEAVENAKASLRRASSLAK